MPNNSPLISIIIPSFNAALTLPLTLDSIFRQRYNDFEIIIVNDGSTDDTLNILKKYDSNKITIINHSESKGVSGARNSGLKLAKGKYICFFDADDQMTINFITDRLEYLEKNSTVGVVCGKVTKKKMETNEIHTGDFNGACENLFEEIINFNNQLVTCPSNYVINRIWLLNTNILFNEKLSSSADKFFLLEILQWGRIHQLDKNNNELIYIVREDSMSHLISKKLIDDNFIFKEETLQKIPLNKIEKRNFSFKMNYILCGSYFKIKSYSLFLKYLILTAILNPIKFIKTRY